MIQLLLGSTQCAELDGAINLKSPNCQTWQIINCYHCACTYSDSKTEALTEAREEGEKFRAAIKQLQQDKRELAEDANSVRVYRDEVESLRVQSAKVEKLEAEVIKYRQKAEDTDYLKKKIAVSHYHMILYRYFV